MPAIRQNGNIMESIEAGYRMPMPDKNIAGANENYLAAVKKVSTRRRPTTSDTNPDRVTFSSASLPDNGYLLAPEE